MRLLEFDDLKAIWNNSWNIPTTPNLFFVWDLGTTPHPVTVTTRIITFLIGNPYKPSFVTVTGWGVDRIGTFVFFLLIELHLQFIRGRKDIDRSTFWSFSSSPTAALLTLFPLGGDGFHAIEGWFHGIEFCTLLGTNISPPKVYLKMIFPLPNVRSVSSLEGMNVHDKHHLLQKNRGKWSWKFHCVHDWTLWKIRGIPSDPPQLKFEILCLGVRATHADPVDELSQ